MENLNLTLTSTEEKTSPIFCSFNPETREEKAKLYRAMTNPDHKVNECINAEIRLMDLFVELVEMTNDENGEVQKVPRCVLFAEDGQTYAATSTGIYNAIKRLCMVYGVPHWDEPIPVVIRQLQVGAKRFYTLDVPS